MFIGLLTCIPCCVCFSVLCFRYVYCVLEICFMVKINVLCFIYVYCDVNYMIYVIHVLCFRHVYYVLHLWATIGNRTVLM